MSLGTILLIVLILILIGAIPTWPYSRSWGYAPSGLLGTVLLVEIILLILGNYSVPPKGPTRPRMRRGKAWIRIDDGDIEKASTRKRRDAAS